MGHGEQFLKWPKTHNNFVLLDSFRRCPPIAVFKRFLSAAQKPCLIPKRRIPTYYQSNSDFAMIKKALI